APGRWRFHAQGVPRAAGNAAQPPRPCPPAPAPVRFPASPSSMKAGPVDETMTSASGSCSHKDGDQGMSQYFTRERPSASPPVRSVVALLFPVILFLACVRPVDATQPPAPVLTLPPHSFAPAASGRALDLADCLDLGDRRHPRIAAQRASLAAAEDGLRA